MLFSTARPVSALVCYLLTSSGDHRPGRPTPCIEALFPDTHPSELVLNVGIGGAPLRFPLSVWFCPASRERGYPENRAMEYLTAGIVGARPWCGVTVGFKYSGTRCTGYVDMMRGDLTALSGYLMSLQ